MYRLKMSLRIVLLFAVVAAVIAAAAVDPTNLSPPSVADMGWCADLSMVKDFDVDKFLGTWYQQMEVPSPFSEEGQCTEITFAKTDAGLNLTSESRSADDMNIKQTFFLSARTRNDTTPYYVMIKDNLPHVEYNVAATDYVSYACTYTCFQIVMGLRVELFFITTRDPNPPENILNKCNDYFYNNFVDTSKLVPVDHSTNLCDTQWKNNSRPAEEGNAGLEEREAFEDDIDRGLRSDDAFERYEAESKVVMTLLLGESEVETDHIHSSGSSQARCSLHCIEWLLTSMAIILLNTKIVV
ncbi:apolipoprotein D isoform X2 [Hyalella azteca]|uniref:Apolipoprotein D isoform X2 n=1 Tax=Hyalella azteca TaxID=294128 RepID=A0A8B7PDH6_HYAAZ|nr:apolipoprotein D isoform X2 [Hyalella azteca]